MGDVSFCPLLKSNLGHSVVEASWGDEQEPQAASHCNALFIAHAVYTQHLALLFYS